jgi:Spy/CpxP family protein refolding chaperone
MNRPWKVILAFLGVFVAGAICGGFLSLRVARHFMEQARTRGPAPMDQFTPQIFRKLSERLELTAAQKEKIRPIIRQADGEMRRLRQTGARDAFAVAERMHEQVAALLTPAQQTLLEDYKRELRERWARDRQMRWGDRPPGGRPPLAPPPGAPPDRRPPEGGGEGTK